MAGGRRTSKPSTPSRCSTTHGQKRPAEFGEVKYQIVNSESRMLGTQAHLPEVRQERHRGLRPLPAPGARSSTISRRPLHARRHGGPLGGAVSDVHRPRRSRAFPAWAPGSSTAWARRASRCRPTSSCRIRTARRKPASRCTHNGFLPAVYQPTMFRPATSRCSISTCPKGVTLGRAAQDPRPDPRAERGQPARRRPGVRRAHHRLRHGVQDADRGAGSLRPQQGTEGDARPLRRRRSERPTTTAAAACWRGAWSRRACASSASSPAAAPGNLQWDAHSDIEENHLRMAGADRQAGRRRCSRT